MNRIESGLFLLVAFGETYFTETVSGKDIVDRMMASMYGEDKSTWDPADADYWRTEVIDEDNWCIDPDVGPTIFKTDVGETDHIELYRISPLSPDAKEAGRKSGACCGDCGLAYSEFGMDLVLPHRQWTIVAEGTPLLCANCIMRRVDKMGGATAIHAVIDFTPAKEGGKK